MKHRRLFASPLFVVAVLTASAVAFAQPPSYQKIATITVPGGLAGFDINWIDPGSQRYYLADRTATKGTGRIDVIDTQTNTLLYTIPSTKGEFGFSGTTPAVTPGCSLSGPNGVVAIPQLHQLYVGDGNSTVKVVDLDAKAVVAIIPTGGNCRADELAFDPLDHIVVIANDQDKPPFLTFISTDTQTVLGRYTYPSTQSVGGGFGGLEQPVWNPKTKRFYLAVPASANSQGSVDVINPITMLVERSILTQCSPAGLVLTPNQRMMTSCGQAFDAISGNSLGVTSGVAGDQIWYNPGDNFYYFGFFGAPLGSGVSVVDANTNQFLTYINASTHSLAVDPNNSHVFIPVSGSGIQVWAAQ